MVLNGELSDFSVQRNEGIIFHAAERYTFIGAAWAGERLPSRRMRVQFEVVDGLVRNVIPEAEVKIDRSRDTSERVVQASSPALQHSMPASPAQKTSSENVLWDLVKIFGQGILGTIALLIMVVILALAFR